MSAKGVITPKFEVAEISRLFTINLEANMPRKISTEASLSFLYLCLKNSDYKSVRIVNRTALSAPLMMLLQIDFTKVGHTIHLPEKSAQQRFRRLRQELESVPEVESKLISARGTPNQDGPAHRGMEEC